MIVRTYTRRNRCLGRAFSDSPTLNGDDSFTDSFSLSQESSQPDIFSLPFSSQDSSPWSFTDSDICAPSKKSKTLPGEKKESSKKSVRVVSAPSTSTLMEAQEFGEMMEHVDEANFALDGLRPGQPTRVQRASLLSLLSICTTAQQRRLLRTQGMAKRIFDAILGLNADDSLSNLAASTLFYVLTSDGQDEHLLDSPSCIAFILKLLNQPTAKAVEAKAPTIGTKLLALSRDPGMSKGATKSLDSGSAAIMSKVEEILLGCRAITVSNSKEDEISRPELCSKWIALLTLEKACLSTVSLEDTSGSVRRVGGHFKEKLREHGGLDAVFDVTINCHSILEGLLAQKVPSAHELKSDVAMQSVVLLLKCLKIMENATFLSQDNQNHLLKLNASLQHVGSSSSFVGLIISTIKILSDISLLQGSPNIYGEESSNTDGTNSHSSQASEVRAKGKFKGGQNLILSSDSAKRCCSIEKTSDLQSKSFKASRRRQNSSSQSEVSISDTDLAKSSNSSVLCHERAGGLNPSISINGNVSKKKSYISEDTKHGSLVDSQDPFAFDEDDLEPSRWETMSSRKNESRPRISSKDTYSEELQLITCNGELINEENLLFCENSCSPEVDEDPNLLGDCLLAAVKVLMNLTNDNSVGCRKIAACGGLEAMAALIIGHFPMFNSCLSVDNNQVVNISFSELGSVNVDDQTTKRLSDRELDFLVAILGLLVNLVEKDSINRAQLAAATVPLPGFRRSKGKGRRREVIPLLCSIFLANQGAGEAVGGVGSPCDDEVAALQGEHEAEKMIVEAYAALLLAFLSKESEHVRKTIASCLPGNNLKVLVPVLERFVAFHLTLNMISPETHKAVSEVIESCRVP